MPAVAGAQTPDSSNTYDSFVPDWGPGPRHRGGLSRRKCGVLRPWSSSPPANGAALLSRLRLEGARTEADIVLGLDTEPDGRRPREPGSSRPMASRSGRSTCPSPGRRRHLPALRLGAISTLRGRCGHAPAPPLSFDGAGRQRPAHRDPGPSLPSTPRALAIVLWVEAAHGDTAGRDLGGARPTTC